MNYRAIVLIIQASLLAGGLMVGIWWFTLWNLDFSSWAPILRAGFSVSTLIACLTGGYAMLVLLMTLSELDNDE